MTASKEYTRSGIVVNKQWNLKLKNATDTEYCLKGKYGLLTNNCATLTDRPSQKDSLSRDALRERLASEHDFESSDDTSQE